MLESKLRRVQRKMSVSASAASNAVSTRSSTRPSVTWADRRRAEDDTSVATTMSNSPRLFRRFQESLALHHHHRPSSTDVSNTGNGFASHTELDNRIRCGSPSPSPSPSSSSRIRRFLHAHFCPPSSSTNSSDNSSETDDNRRGATSKSAEAVAVAIDCDNSRSSTPPPLSVTVSPSLAAKVLFGRQLSVNFGNVLADDEMCYGENDFVVQCLHWHNVFRDVHQAPPLVLSSQLCQSAQQWANTLAHNEMFYHGNPRDCGENLLTRSSCDPEYDVSGHETSASWYGGIKQYNFNAEPQLLHVNAGQFTQMVWRDSTHMGVGKARTRGGKVVVVAHYRPPGNVFRRFKENVLPSRLRTTDTPNDSDGGSESTQDNDEDNDQPSNGLLRRAAPSQRTSPKPV